MGKSEWIKTKYRDDKDCQSKQIGMWTAYIFEHDDRVISFSLEAIVMMGDGTRMRFRADSGMGKTDKEVKVAANRAAEALTGVFVR